MHTATRFDLLFVLCMPIRILIAEDNPAVRTAVRQLLENASPWEIVEVENGHKALAQAPELRPNLIILDLVMPVMDGLAAAREISKILPDIPLLMYTLHWSPQVELEAQKVGVRKVVSKSDSKLLLSIVQQLLAAEPSIAPGSEPGPLDISAPAPTVAPTPPAIESGKVAASDPSETRATGPGEVPRDRPPN